MAYDSRTDRPMSHGTHRAMHDARSWEERGKGDWISYGTPPARQLATPTAERKAITEGILAYLDGDERANQFPADCEMEWALAAQCDREVPSRHVLDRLHGEAIAEDAKRTEDIEAEAWEWLKVLDAKDMARRDAEDALGYEGEDDRPNMYTHDECWLPLLTVSEARQHFGPDWEHNGFQIIKP